LKVVKRLFENTTSQKTNHLQNDEKTNTVVFSFFNLKV